MSFPNEENSGNDSDYYERDLGREVIEKNIRNRLQRIADSTKEELNQVLKRVDATLDNYEYSVQSSLIQHGMTINDMSSVEHVADIKELENLLNDSLAKQRYKQRLMVFIVGQTEQASEKAQLLQQIGQFFSEQKQSFSARELNTFDNTNAPPDEVDTALKSFDVKDCFIHVKTLGTRLTELNEDIIHYLIQNAGSKQQAKGKKKLAQAARETREQLTSLQSKLELANTEMINRDNQIEALEKDIEKMHDQSKTFQNKLQQYETEIQSCKTQINELEDHIEQYKTQIDDLNRTMQQTVIEDTPDTNTVDAIQTEVTDQKSEETDASNQIDVEEVQITTISNVRIQTPPMETFDKEVQTSNLPEEHSEQIPSENIDSVNLFFNSTEGIDLNNSTMENLHHSALVRISELLKELEMKESMKNDLQQQFNEYRKVAEEEEKDLIEKSDNAYQLQIKAQRTAEEAISHLQSFMTEQEKLKPELVHQEAQTDKLSAPVEIAPSPEYTNLTEESPNDESYAHSKITTDELEFIENFRRNSLKDKYISLIEEKRQKLDQLKQQADVMLSRPTSIRERLSLQSLESSAVTGLIKQQQVPFSPFDRGEGKENQTDVELVIKQDEEQQTSLVSSRRSSIHKENMIQSDQLSPPFVHLYNTIYKFRQSIIYLLEQNKLFPLANHLRMTKQLSSDDHSLTSEFLENVEHVLKDITKVLQTSMATFQSAIDELQRKEREVEPVLETAVIDNQQAILLEQKESMLVDLTNRYEQLTNVSNQTSAKHQEESNANQRLIHDQEKLNQSLQQDVIRLQKQVVKIETEGFIQPSIMFTRLDAERNEQTLQQAVYKGKVPNSTYEELSEAMIGYVQLPSQQLSNLVKRYIQFRRATEFEGRIQTEALDNNTRSVLEKIESLHEQRCIQMGQRMTNIRQQRSKLAKILTKKFDELEDESSIFLIRPVYSYQGRAATQSYMRNEERRQEAFLKENVAKKKHSPSRLSEKTLSTTNQQVFSPTLSLSASDEEDRPFRIGMSVPSTNEQHDDGRQTPVRLGEMTRLQELDFQRVLMPISHTTTSLLPGFTNNTVDPSVPSLNLRSYMALSRPGVSSFRMGKSNDIATPTSRDGRSSLSGKSQTTNPCTPYNSSASDLRRIGPSLPPIKRSLPSGVVPLINEKARTGLLSSTNTSEISTVD